ncbi:RNA polymerase subunit sigma-24 [Cohnella kolymensis]|uniref:RNA polymerase subunit sigma-24 n=1 Tax=Cohnella kolymensis TaxID=1590652 RepID=A0ABR5A3Z2_9BACL|nr:RNA polymerase sigma factor [Cohnella kolymensis]KIL35773.1 RNA polymerase subunit sigma-24 [Cohnella kolymensis]
MSDEELIRKAQKGDFHSFEVVVMKLKDRAYRIAYSYLRNESNSMDAVSDAVVKALLNIKKLREPKFFSTWFMRIVINESKIQLRKRQTTIDIADSLYIPGTKDTSAEVMDLEQTLSNLPPIERLIIQMKYYLGYSFEEIADMTEMPLGTVKTKLYTTLRQLRVKLEVK